MNNTAPEPHWLTIITYVFVIVTCFAILLSLMFGAYEWWKLSVELNALKGAL